MSAVDVEASKARSVLAYAPDEIFQKSWQTYQLVVDSGLLGHAKLASSIASALAELRKSRGRPLRVLDLGSGDAGVLTRAISAEASSSSFPSPAEFVSQYTAVDESEPALALASRNVEENLPGCEGRFQVGDLLSAAEEAARAGANESGPPPSSSIPPPEGGYDAIVASLSAHHLSTERGKPALVAAARKALWVSKEGEPEGDAPSSRSLFVVADIFLRDEGDTVEAWRDRCCSVIRDRWPEREPALSREEASRIASHVGSCDIPATLESYREMARDAGFGGCEKVADVCEELGIRVVVMEA